jgi:hypothetical protein
VAAKEFAIPTLCLPCGFAADNSNRRTIRSTLPFGSPDNPIQLG